MQERDLFLEELRNKFCQVYAPVFPDMTVGRLIVDVRIAVRVKDFAEFLVFVIEEILLADSHPVKLGLSGKLCGKFAGKVGINF